MEITFLLKGFNGVKCLEEAVSFQVSLCFDILSLYSLQNIFVGLKIKILKDY